MPENKFIKSAGAMLREAREAKGISLEEASRATHIHVNVLKKIETDDLSSIGVVYAKGFLKIYAEYLGLDKNDIVERFFSAVPAYQRSRSIQKVIIPGTTPRAAGKNSFSAIFQGVISRIKKIDFKIVAVVVLCMVFFLGFRALVRAMIRKKSQKPVAQAAFSESARAVAEKKNIVEPKKKTASVVPEKTAVSAPAPHAVDKVVLVVRARAKTWLQVKVDGKVVFQNVLARGAAESWTAAKKIEMMIGNAGAVELELNGRILEKIGRPGQTLKHVVVTRDGLAVNK